MEETRSSRGIVFELSEGVQRDRPASRLSSRPPTPRGDSEDDSLDQEPLLPRYADESSRTTPTPPTQSLIRSRALRVAVLAFLALCVGVWTFRAALVDGPRSSRVDVWSSLEAANATKPDPLASTRAFLANSSTRNLGLVPFTATFASPVLVVRPLQHTLASSSFRSSTCRDGWIARGQLCDELRNQSAALEQPRMDVIFTWTNGSQAELMYSWKDQASRAVGLTGWKRRLRRALGANVVKHFREHGELRYSVRSVVDALGQNRLANVHLVVGDTPIYPPGREDTIDADASDRPRYAQAPHWLNFSSIEVSQAASEEQSSGPSFHLRPHSELFKVAASETDAVEWQDKVLPSFNSLAIESQLPNLELESPTAAYFNDDFFVMQPLAVADFESPLTGPVFRMQRDLLVGGVAPGSRDVDPESEWKSLGMAAYLLDRRFGTRRRPYLIHVAKAVSTPMLAEVQAVFADDLRKTAEARFRGKGPVEAQTMHLLVHYTVEKHREALLWSFLVARSNPSLSSTYSPADRRRLLSELGFEVSADPAVTTIAVETPRRKTLASLAASFGMSGVPPPKQTRLDFSSQDGYLYFGLEATSMVPQYEKGWPSFDQPFASGEQEETPGPSGPVCELDLEFCFGGDFLDPTSSTSFSVEETFKRIAFAEPSCGDCLIAHLVGRSGKTGLDAFLPAMVRSDDSVRRSDAVDAIGLGGTTWDDLDFLRDAKQSGSLREFATSLIQRYSYALGSSSTAFYSLKYPGQGLTNLLNTISSTENGHEPPAFLALNDDVMASSASLIRDVDRRMGEWFESVWPNPSPWELSPSHDS
ncbi:hypothetical protein JCM10212_002079 [Sporobolomyces blumeae]